MLNRIENISPNSAYKEKPHYPSINSEALHVVSNLISIYDSSNFSEAIKYWGVLKWKLKQFKQTPNGHIEIEFSIDDFNFKITMPEPYYKAQVAEFVVTYKQIDDSREIKKIVRSAIKFSPKVLSPNSNPVELFFLKALFNRILEFYAVNPQFEITSDTGQTLIDELKEGLVSELSEIHNKLIHFLDKVTDNYYKLPSYNLENNEDKNSGDTEILEIALQNFQ